MNQPVTWIIEHHIFEEDQELTLIEEVKKQRGEVKLIDPLSKHNFDYEHSYWLEDRPVIFRGSLNIGKKARRQPWYPGVICNQKAFKCSTYYTYWGKWMLNKEYWMMPISQVFNNKFIEACLWSIQDNNVPDVFIRPDSSMKQFTGGIFNLNNLESLKDIKPETLVLVAPVKKITKEYRFVVADNKVITGSQYYENGKYILSNTSLSNMTFIASCYLKGVLHNITWQPDPIYTVDVCESEGEFSILELNSFSCSNLYFADLSKVVEAANEIASK